jgi:3-oxoacyl-[acyl-carrier-protein] synthase-3
MSPNQLHSASIIGTGAYTPERILTNAYFEKLVDTSDEWITSRTGIKRRHVVEAGMATTEMSERASRLAIAAAGIEPADIDMILVGTVTPDMALPSAAALLQNRLGAYNAGISDMVAACAGFIYGLGTARAFVVSGQYKNVLVLGAETLTSITNYKDRGTCVLFGDGAGAAIVSRSESGGRILSSCLRGDGRQWEDLHIPKGGSATPLENGDLENGNTCIRMNGSEVFKYAVRGMVESSKQALEDAGLTSADVSLFIPHQANIRIMEAVAKRLSLPLERVLNNIEEYGNTSAASVPIGLHEAVSDGRIKPGDVVLLSAFGAGFCWGSAVIQY